MEYYVIAVGIVCGVLDFYFGNSKTSKYKGLTKRILNAIQEILQKKEGKK